MCTAIPIAAGVKLCLDGLVVCRCRTHHALVSRPSTSPTVSLALALRCNGQCAHAAFVGWDVSQVGYIALLGVLSFSLSQSWELEVSLCEGGSTLVHPRAKTRPQTKTT